MSAGRQSFISAVMALRTSAATSETNLKIEERTPWNGFLVITMSCKRSQADAGHEPVVRPLDEEIRVVVRVGGHEREAFVKIVYPDRVKVDVVEVEIVANAARHAPMLLEIIGDRLINAVAAGEESDFRLRLVARVNRRQLEPVPGDRRLCFEAVQREGVSIEKIARREG